MLSKKIVLLSVSTSLIWTQPHHRVGGRGAPEEQIGERIKKNPIQFLSLGIIFNFAWSFKVYLCKTGFLLS